MAVWDTCGSEGDKPFVVSRDQRGGQSSGRDL